MSVWPPETRFDLYGKALAADKAFSEELKKVFGKEACNARYDRRATSTPTLAKLAAEKIATDKAWQEQKPIW